MIKSLKEAHNAQIHYLKSGDIDKAATMSELLSVMLAQEILNAFGGIGTTDMCVIVAACKLAISVVEDSAEKAGLTAAERDEVERVVMAEAGAEPYIGQMAVAQCILNACEQENARPAEIVKRYGYTDKRPEPSYKVKSAVSDVFDDGNVATDAEILYFYAPELCQSIWHESQTYVCTIGGHRFFEEAGK